MSYLLKIVVSFVWVVFLISCHSEMKKVKDLSHKIEKTETEIVKIKNNSEFVLPPTICFFDHLSTQFNFRLYVEYVNIDSTKIYVIPIGKDSNKIKDSISIESSYLMLPPMYGKCDDIRSFSTGFNADKEVIDNCPGIFIVADFNFDGKDDFAVAVDSGGNGGYIYSFYLQTKNGEFIIDRFLTEEVLRFPVSMDSKLKTITTSVHANVSQNCETIYKLNGRNWTQISQKFIEY